MGFQPVTELHELIGRVVFPLTPEGHWLWTPAPKPGKPCRVRFRGFQHRVDRLFYDAFRGQLYEGIFLVPNCEEGACVNPWHFCAMPRGMALSATKIQTHCYRGHPYEGADLIRQRGGTGRKCRICTRDNDRRSRRRRLEKSP